MLNTSTQNNTGNFTLHWTDGQEYLEGVSSIAAGTQLKQKLCYRIRYSLDIH